VSALHPALEGLIVGIIVAIILYWLEHHLLKKQAKERAIRQHRPNQVEFDSTEKARLHSVGRMCFAVPPFFAAMYWMIA
jgi:hypothetical protein